MINKRIASAIATGSLLLSSFATPAFAATTINLSGNGTESNNTANVNLTRTNTVVQNNTANVSNNVDVDADTGNNDANDNTGGDVAIDTGNSSVAVAIQNLLNKNSASVGCCDSGDTSVKIADNGSYSDNDVDLDMDNSNEIFQDNDAKVKNDVDADAKTGNNDANDNTNGDVSIDTGRAEVAVGILNALNANFASIGGGDNGGGGNGLSLWVVGNGTKSDNYIDADVDKSNTITQDNNAKVYNDLDVDAKTGHNDANDNTGGEVSIDTGNASVDALVANFGNFNWADLSCDCLFDDVNAKIANNGSNSDNDIDLDLDDSNDLFQDNYAKADNDLYLDAKTGKNDAEDNTSGSDGDPSIDTGNSDVNAEVVSQFNANEASIGGGFEFDFDWEEIFGSVGL